MSLQDNRSPDEKAIRELVDRFTKSIRAKDIDAVMSVFAPSVISFDLGAPLQHGGGAEFAKRWHELFEAYHGPIQYEIRDLTVAVSGNLAFTHSLNRIAGTTKNGHTGERWLRWTACVGKADGKWLIVHEHVSVPVDAKTGMAAFDLKP